MAKPVAEPDYVIQSLRHSMRNRLCAINCPSDMIDQIGGRSSGEVGEGYVERRSLIKEWDLLRKIN